MKKHKIPALFLTVSLMAALMGGCSSGPDTGSGNITVSAESAEETTAGSAEGTDSTSSENSGTAASVTNYTTGTAVTVEEVHAADAEDSKTEITGEFLISSSESGGVTQSGTTYTITKAGEYTVSGCLADGNIVIDAGDSDEVTIVLSGASISCSTASPIYAANADKVKIKVEEGTYNEIMDTREQKNTSASGSSSSDDSDTEETSADPTTGNGAVYSKADLNISGKGALVVSGTYNNGIQSTKDLKIKNVIMKVTGVNNALKGNDSVDIESGQLILISTGGDGIKTSDSDVSSKGNQRGTVTIEGGIIDIYAACDGIDAAYDADISGEGNLNIYTDSYSDYSSDVVTSGADFYLIVPTSLYSEDYDYYAYFYNSDESDGSWSKASYATMVSGGMTQYYGLLLQEPSDYENVAYYRFTAGAEPSVESYDATSAGGAVNSDMNGYLISDISSSAITGDYVSLSRGNSANSDKTEYSTKGIKADNEVTIADMTIVIYCKDDGIHANGDVTLESGETGAGNVTVNSGTIMITAADDGIHADSSLTINDGYINVVQSYEGLEGNLVTINGGETYVYASDDAVNASAGNETPLVSVTGGYLDVTTPSGDTDAIDSNGNYEQSGGYVFVKGGASTGSMAGSIDVDGSVTVTGGATVALGGICETPEDSVNAYAESGTSFASGEYTLTDADGNQILAFTITGNGSYSSFWIASEKLEEGTTYTLSQSGSEVSSWEQESGTTGDAASGFGMGGFGGRGGH